jgi:hypothetical protein
MQNLKPSTTSFSDKSLNLVRFSGDLGQFYEVSARVQGSCGYDCGRDAVVAVVVDDDDDDDDDDEDNGDDDDDDDW